MFSRISRARRMTTLQDKGKGRQVQSAIEEALDTPLPSVVDTGYASPIARPPPAHRPAYLRPVPQRLFSQLTRATMPSASLSYAQARPQVTRASDADPSMVAGPSSSPWRTGDGSMEMLDGEYPDLDPGTGLPMDRTLSGPGSDAPSLQLQRTITQLLKVPLAPTPSLFSFQLPSLPSLPSLQTGQGARREMSTNDKNDDWMSWTSGWWSGNKARVDETLSKDDQADTVEEEQEKHRRKYKTPKNPVVFCHGLLGFDYLGPASLPTLQINHWRGIREVLESNGTEVLITRVAATASIADRAATLEKAIAEKYPGREVNLIGHSMGGLDCRYLVSNIRPQSFRPVSVTTISTPHRGSPFADYVVDNVIGRERLPTLLSLMQAMRLPDSGDGSAFNALGTRSMRVFNSEVLDRDDVAYYSWGASFEPGLLDTFRWPHSVILAKEGPNDGLVSVTSAKWGEYRGTLLGVNHLDLVGWVNRIRYVMSGWTGNPIEFKPATFYLEVADFLAEQGF